MVGAGQMDARPGYQASRRDCSQIIVHQIPTSTPVRKNWHCALGTKAPSEALLSHVTAANQRRPISERWIFSNTNDLALSLFDSRPRDPSPIAVLPNRGSVYGLAPASQSCWPDLPCARAPSMGCEMAPQRYASSKTLQDISFVFAEGTTSTTHHDPKSDLDTCQWRREKFGKRKLIMFGISVLPRRAPAPLAKPLHDR